MAVVNLSARRKSCQRCIKGKRRCDLQRPLCGRCFRGRWSCTYDHFDIGQPTLIEYSNDYQSPSDEDPVEDKFEGLAYPPNYFAEPVSLSPERLRNCSERLRQSAALFVRDAATTFIKPTQPLEQLQTPLRDALAICAMYFARTPQNKTVVRQALTQASTALMADAVDWTVEEELANVQAALLLHILQLFDSDIDCRRAAESNMDTLRPKVLRLQRRAADGMSDEINATYGQWVFMESFRRTILIATLAEGIFVNLNEGVCKTVPFMAMLPITVAGSLWNATSGSEWKKLRKRIPLTVLTYGEAVGWWKDEAAKGTLDELQLLLFIACKGTSDVHPSRRQIHGS